MLSMPDAERRDDVGNVAHDEQVAGPRAGQQLWDDAAVGAADEHHLGLLALARQLRQAVRLPFRKSRRATDSIAEAKDREPCVASKFIESRTLECPGCAKACR